MNELLEFRRKFDACMQEAGHPPPGWVGLDSDGWLHIRGGPVDDSGEYLAALVQALRLTAPTFEPAARLLEATERELAL